MADAERKLTDGRTRVEFETDPSRYRHWKLAVDGEVATLTMDVDEKGALFEGYDAPPTAEGVSGATTRTVVTSSLAILGLDFILTSFMFRGA